MKKLIPTFLVFAVISCHAQSPVVDFQKNYGGSNTDFGFSFVNTLDGGYLLGGVTESMNGDVTFNYGGTDIWVVKTNPNGVKEWAKSYGGSLNERLTKIIKNSDGSFVFVGETSSNDFDIAGARGNYDGWLVQLNSNGIIDWKKNLGGNSGDYLHDVIRTIDGGLLAVGTTYSNNGQVSGNHGSTDAWAIKLDTNGNLEWSKCFGGSLDEAFNQVVELQDGNFAIIGVTTSTNGDITNPKGQRDIWVVKINTLGGLIWQKNIGGSGFDSGSSIIETDEENLIIAGSSNSSDGDTALAGNGGFDFWVVKTNALGSIIWEKKIGTPFNEGASEMMKTDDNGCIVIGTVNSNSGFPNANFGQTDVGLIKLKQDGSILWTTAVGEYSHDEAYKILLNNDKLALSGYANILGSTANFWLVQFQPQILSTIDSIAKSFVISPNPVTDIMHLDNESNLKIDKITILDISGKQLISIVDSTEDIDTSKLQSGMYIVKIDSEKTSYQIKIFKK